VLALLDPHVMTEALGTRCSSGRAGVAKLPPRRRETRDAVAVGTRVSSRAPRTEPYVRLSRIRLVWDFLCQGCITPLLSFFVASFFVRPAPRAFFRPDRILPSPSRNRTALLQRRRRLVLDQREHGGRLPVIGWFTTR